MTMNQTAVRITGVGAELPPAVVTTAEVEERAGIRERFGLEPGWLEHVTGVRTRRWASPEVQPSELAAAAARKALERAGVDPLAVDTLVLVAAAVATVPGVEAAAPSVRGAAHAAGGELLTVYGVELGGDAAERVYGTRLVL